MSEPVAAELYKVAEDMRADADYLREEASEMLADDSFINDMMAADFMEQAARADMVAGVVEAIADFADWITEDEEETEGEE
jgi:hypothetical protein